MAATVEVLGGLRRQNGLCSTCHELAKCEQKLDLFEHAIFQAGAVDWDTIRMLGKEPFPPLLSPRSPWAKGNTYQALARELQQRCRPCPSRRRSPLLQLLLLEAHAALPPEPTGRSPVAGQRAAASAFAMPARAYRSCPRPTWLPHGAGRRQRPARVLKVI